ncbi:MAG TPA: OsmC family protein [Gemmatimonadaceae bacterium]|nr:OsmC family protein [Gemmatimonadaceae bacterium]
MAAGHSHAPMIVTHEGGMKYAVEIRGHRLVVDQPERSGGRDEGPMPLELLGAALGTCVALYVQRYCATRGLPTDGMRVEVEQIGAQNPPRIGEFKVRVVMPAELPEHHMAMLERVARSCPVHGTLEHGAHVDIALEIPAPTR